MNKLFSVFLFAMPYHAVAFEQDNRGLYLGAGFGKTTYEEDDWTTSNATGIRSNDSSWKIIAGYRINSMWHIEGTYTSYGTIEQIDRYKFEPNAFTLAANGGYTFSNAIRPFGIIGLSALDLSQSQPILQDDKGIAIRLGFGIEYMPTQFNDVTLRIAYEGDGFAVSNRSFIDVDTDIFLGSYYFSATYALSND
ncbi:porin family protein [Photobacterium makurazakiensis]|uniref:outer membrane beta-barrel protein n=1 Tax=Photobacterium makurazakiensis TaxID=2910234 RepID=UPI003D140F56